MNSSKLKVAMVSFASLLRFLRLYIFEHLKCSSLLGYKSYETPEKKKSFQAPESDKKDADEAASSDGKVFEETKKSRSKRQKPMGWKCVDNCCWIIGCMCTTSWLLLLLLYIVLEALSFGKGSLVLHLCFVSLWGGWGSGFTDIFRRPVCWMEHLSLHYETGLDPPGIRVRPVPGLVAADYFAPGYFNTEVRDRSLSRLKVQIEMMSATNGDKKVVVFPHSMGAVYFLHFLKWVESPAPVGGGGGSDWCAKHIKAVVNIGPTFLGVPKALSTILSAEGKYISLIRAMASGLLEYEFLGLQTIEHVMRVSKRRMQALLRENNTKSSEDKSLFQVQDPKKYGRIISFGKEASKVLSSQLPTFSKEFMHASTSTNSSASRGEFWTEYDEMSRENFWKIAENKVYTTTDLVDLLRYVAPKMMQRAEAHYSHGIAENLEDTKYNHHKYWSNPLETVLPNAPDMETYYGSDSCLKGGVYFVDGDESVPVLSSGFMCAKGWRGKTRFNPSGSATYVREYRHKEPSSMFEGRGLESAGHVDIMGNVALIEDVLRIAAGATGSELGGDKIHSNLLKMCDRVNIPL
ncbi:hypothetical protein POM88_013460 [Heracleum sosnowskyi]|uniref:Phospholipid:diacylglycerol acyltransferase 2 n=1 Tax=Heracleum sosnowskyi TaxID=360622 RepID=A0AAD8IYI9_9APIA|nr:hypothetical protein POM88_013460 [Heracleum sosnowskyi]